MKAFTTLRLCSNNVLCTSHMLGHIYLNYASLEIQAHI